MADTIQVAAVQGGALRLLAPETKVSEAVLALPLSRLIVRMVRVPAEQAGDPVAFATPILQAMSPFTDEQLTVSCERVSEDARGQVVIAAALPEGATDDIAEQLDQAKLNVTRVDALLLGLVRGIWNNLGCAADARKLLLVDEGDGLALLAIDGDSPSAIRSVSLGSDLRREIMLSLLEAEDFGGARPLAEIVAVGNVDAAGLESLAPVRRIEVGEDAGLVGVAERATDAAALNALPASWGEVLAETRFKKKLTRNLSVAGGIWALVMAVLFGGPIVIGMMTDHQKQLSKEHQRKYQEVLATKEKVDVVRKYSDHNRGALEIMKAVSDRLPQGITLSSWNFKREEGVSVAGLADDATVVYEFKNAMAAVGTEPAEGEEEETVGEAVFPSVDLKGPSGSKDGQKFELSCAYAVEEEE